MLNSSFSEHYSFPCERLFIDLQHQTNKPTNKSLDMDKKHARVGDWVLIISMNGEPQYSNRAGKIERIDSIGQLHGTWGGIAINPEEDEYELVKIYKI